MKAANENVFSSTLLETCCYFPRHFQHMLDQKATPETLDPQYGLRLQTTWCFEYFVFGVVLWVLMPVTLGMPRKLSTVNAYTTFLGVLSVFYRLKIEPHDISDRQIWMNHKQ